MQTQAAGKARVPRRRGFEQIICRPLGALEAEAVAVVWKLGECSVRDVMRQLAMPTAYTTVMTTLARLFTKGVLQRRKLNRKFLYSPRFTVEEWQEHAAREAATRFLSTPYTSPELLISCLREAIAQRAPALLVKMER